MLFYLFLWAIITLLITPKKKLGGDFNVVLQIIGGVIYVFFSTFRNVTHNHNLDIFEYYLRFNKADCNLFTYFKISQCEPGYSLLAWIIKNTTNSFTVFLLIIHVFVYIAHVFFLNKIIFNYQDTNKIPYSFESGIIYSTQLIGINRYFLSGIICLNLFSAYYIQRNILSLCFVYFYLILINENKIEKSFCLLSLAVMFHYSAVILFVSLMFFIILKYSKNISRKKLFFLLVLSFAFVFFALKYIGKFMNESKKYSYYKQEGSLAILTVSITIFVLIIYFLNYKRINTSFIYAQKMGIALSTMLLIIPLQNSYSIMYRMYLFFLPIIAVMFVYIAQKANSISKVMISGALVVYFSYRCFSFFNNEIQYIGDPYVFLHLSC